MAGKIIRAGIGEEKPNANVSQAKHALTTWID